MTSLQTWAQTLRDLLLENGVEKAEIAGGVRRGKPDPHDLEIVAQCRTRWVMKKSAGGSLFGDEETAESIATLDNDEMDDWITGVIQSGMFALDEVVKRNGPRYKRFKMGEATGLGERGEDGIWNGFVFELFVADERNFGNMLTIRTGDEDFSQLLVTRQFKGGLLPNSMWQADGYLRQFDSAEACEKARELKEPEMGRIIECPTEEAFFEASGVPWIKPDVRCKTAALDLKGRL